MGCRKKTVAHTPPYSADEKGCKGFIGGFNIGIVQQWEFAFGGFHLGFHRGALFVFTGVDLIIMWLHREERGIARLENYNAQITITDKDP